MDGGSSERLVLTGASVFDVESGEAQTADVALVADRIVDVGHDLDGDSQVDCSGFTLFPGLIDCHAHMAFHGLSDASGTPPSYRLLEALSDLKMALQLGVTTVRDGWGADAGLRDAIEAGFIQGPRLLISLAQIGGTGSIGDHFGLGAGELDWELGSPSLPKGVFDGADDARRVVRTMVRSGADVIKVAVTGSVTQGEAAHHQHIADDELSEIVFEAVRHNRHVMAHAHGARGIEAAARAGVRSIEHGWFLDERALEAMVKNDTWLVPTLSPGLGSEDEAEAPGWLTEAIEAAKASFRLAMEADIPIAMGTDCPGRPHAERLNELGFMHQLGMSSEDVWRAATVRGAELIGRDDLGVIEPGRRADIVAVEGDITHFENLSGRVKRVWKDGRPVQRPST